MQVSIQQVANLIGVYNASAGIAFRAFESAGLDCADAATNITPAIVSAAVKFMAAERESRLNVNTIKASPVLDILGGFDAIWEAETDALNGADRIVSAVESLVAR